MTTSCSIPPYDELVRMTQDRELLAEDETTGAGLLALCAAHVWQARTNIVPLGERSSR